MAFQFNTYSTFLLLPFSQGILFSILLMGKTQDGYQKSNLILGIILFLLSIKIAFWMLGFAGWYDSHDAHTTFMFYFPYSMICLTGPLIYFYFLSVTNQHFKFERKHLHHFWLPAIWLLLIVGKFSVDYLFYYPFPKTANFQFGTRGPFAELDKTITFTLISYGSLLYYLILTLKSFHAYRQYVSQNLSSSEKIDFIWLRNILLAICSGILIMFIYQIINWFHPLSYRADWYSYLFLGVLIYYVGIKGYVSQHAIKPALYFTPGVNESIDQKPIDPLAAVDLEKWVEKLEKLFDQQKPYLIPDLTLSQLSGMIAVNAVLLSRVINTGYQLNFNDFINSYRIKEVLSRIDAGRNKTVTLLTIAFESGFNSKATFNRAFKKQMGKTPLEYIKGKE